MLNMSRLGHLTLAAVFLSHCTASTPQENIVFKSLETLLHKIEPQATFDMTSANGGFATAVGDGAKVEFQIVANSISEVSGEFQIAGVLQFPIMQNDVLIEFLETATITKTHFLTRVFCVQNSATGLSLATQIVDEQALALSVSEIRVGNILGENSTQISFTGTSHYAFNLPKEHVVAERLYVYDLPELEKRVAITQMRQVYAVDGFNTDSILVRQISIHKRDEKSPAVLRVHTPNKGVTDYSLAPDQADLLPVDTPWVRDEKRLEDEVAPTSPKDLRVRLLDSNGKPVAGARLRGWQEDLIRPLDSTLHAFDQLADSEGRFEIPVTMRRVSFKVHAQGYVESRFTFLRPEIPPNEVELVLEREKRPVRLRTSGELGPYAWTIDKTSYEIGLRFGESEELWRGGQWVENKQLADIWFLIEKIEDVELKDFRNARNNLSWQISLEGLNGWEIQKGPETSHTRSAMLEAPASGYSDKASFVGTIQNTRNHFYLRLNGGKLFGKLHTVKFTDASTTAVVQRRLSLEYSVQAEENGTRSLNPL